MKAIKVEYEAINSGDFCSGIDAKHPAERKDILILNLTYPKGDSEQDKEIRVTEVGSVIEYIQCNGYRGIVANFTGDDPIATMAAAYCHAFKEAGLAYWFVNCTFQGEENRIPGIIYEEPEQRERNARSIDKAVDKLISLMG
ncbi:hypothetical protein J4444_04485 [Candidatus Woesearchaeota archaeon]|nr:hypothetical protein [Candidatus Woesearchaeota archaeon]